MALFFSSQSFSVAVKPDVDFVVEKIEVIGLQRTDLGTFFNLLPLQVGERLEVQRIPIIIRTIYSSNTFDNVQLYRSDNILYIKVSERPIISEIEIDGNSDIKTEQILEAMKQSGFEKGEVFDPSAIQAIKIGIEEQYFSHGKYSIKIEDEVIKQSRNRIKVNFDINEGNPAKIQKISIIGNKLFSEDELLDQFELSEGGWLSFFSSANQYSREKLSGDLEKLRSFYLDRGYLTYNNTSTQVSISPDREGIYLTINLEEGKKFTISDIVFSGDLILSQEQLKKLMPLIKGDTYSAAVVSFSEERIKESLGYLGYAFAKVVTVPNIDEENKTVELTLYVEPGKKVYVNRINFTGNDSTNEQVLRREVRLMESGALSTQSVERSKLRLQRLSYLERVDVETPKVQDKVDQVNINYKVKERQAGTISGGVGYSDTFKLSLNASVSHSNFLGSGKTVGFSINKNRFTENYNLSYLDPYFTLDGISAGASVYYRTSDFGSINLFTSQLDSTGFDFNMGYPVNEITRLNFGLGFQSSKLKAGSNNISEQVVNFYRDNGQDVRVDPDFDYKLYRLSASWRRNTLNRGIFPDRGNSQVLSLSGTGPGSDLQYYKIDYRVSNYLPIARGWTFLTSFRASWGDGYGDNENLPYFENFNAGGSGTLRGFDANTVGPRLIQRVSQAATSANPVDPADPANPANADQGPQVSLPPEFDTISISNRGAGGNARLLGTLELIFPLPFAEESNSVRTSLFVDAGNVWDTKFSIEDYADLNNLPADFPDYSDPDAYRLSTGLSLQWLSPLGPLTLSFSKALKQQQDDETEFFSFDIGRTF